MNSEKTERATITDGFTIHHNGRTNVIERVFSGVVIDRYTTQDLTLTRRGDGWAAQVSEFLMLASMGTGYTSKFPWQEHEFSAVDVYAICSACGKYKTEGNHVTAYVVPSPEDVTAWWRELDKEEIMAPDEFMTLHLTPIHEVDAEVLL